MHTDLLNTITEVELLRISKFNAIKKLRIEETPNGTYLTHITFAKEDQEQTLITQRKAPREWASLDRLAKHIRNNYGFIPKITLTLHPTDDRSYINDVLQRIPKS